jgi:AmmeMemoRadiSam system protein B/AmmeMemoRadiSam system protein A
MIRQPAVAGQFYPGSAGQLKEMIGGMVDSEADKEEVVGLVSPHAGYIYSGPIAGATISRIKFKETFIIIGPNHTGMGKPFSIMSRGSWQTPLGDVAIDSELAGYLLSKSSHFEEDVTAHQFEHSVEVQLPFLQYFKKDIKLVPIVLAHTSGTAYKEIGRDIAQVIKESGKEVIIIASSDMTHYESQDSAQRKDSKAIEAILDLDEDRLLSRIGELNISMCGYAPVVALISAARGLGASKAELIKYQTSGDVTGDFSSVVGYVGIIIKAAAVSPPVKLARQAIESFVKEGKVVSPPEDPPLEMQGQAGVFVSLHRFGQLRGCIGTFEPTKENIAREIIFNAISSATRDPRFPPVTPGELESLDYSVDILTRPEPAAEKDQLNPKKYGVIVEYGSKKGLLLPDLEGVDSIDQQIDICRRKAGIMPGEPVKLSRFTVKRYR